MKLKTKYFGEMEYTEKEQMHLMQGLFGFEEEKDFVLIHFSDDNDDLLCLQSTKTANLAFIVMNPFSLDPEYHPLPSEQEVQKLHVESEQELYYYVICVVRDDAAATTVNLKCPILLNPKTNIGLQIILSQDEYQMRHRLSDLEAKKGKEA